jgi:hypothetical protein
VLGARKQSHELSNQNLQAGVQCDLDLLGTALDLGLPVDSGPTKLAEQHRKPEAKVPKLRKEMEMHQFADLLAQKCSKLTS